MLSPPTDSVLVERIMNQIPTEMRKWLIDDEDVVPELISTRKLVRLCRQYEQKQKVLKHYQERAGEERECLGNHAETHQPPSHCHESDSHANTRPHEHCESHDNGYPSGNQNRDHRPHREQWEDERRQRRIERSRDQHVHDRNHNDHRPHQHDSNNSHSNHTHGQHKHHDHKSGAKPDDVCRTCGEKGHWAKDCKKRAPDNRNGFRAMRENDEVTPETEVETNNHTESLENVEVRAAEEKDESDGLEYISSPESVSSSGNTQPFDDYCSYLSPGEYSGYKSTGFASMRVIETSSQATSELIWQCYVDDLILERNYNPNIPVLTDQGDELDESMTH